MLNWVEKYRPKQFVNIKTQTDIVKILEYQISNDCIHNMIFYGNPGCGKTSIIYNLVSKFYGNEFNNMILEINTSEVRGIQTIRNTINNFTNIKLINEKTEIKYKFVILDEIDLMTIDAQLNLCSILDSTSKTKFCLICNYISYLIPDLKSRCNIFKFNKIDNNDVLDVINNICSNENLNLTDDAKSILVKYSGGDLRKCINTLQSLYVSYNDTLITEEKISNLFNVLSVNTELNILNNIIKLPNIEAIKFIYQIKNIYQITDYKLHQILSNILIQKVYNVELLLNFLKYESNLINNDDDDIILKSMIMCIKKYINNPLI